MAFRVTKLRGLIGLLIARRACAKASLMRAAQKCFYTDCDSVLLPLEFSLHRLLRNGSEAPTVLKRITPSHVLLKCKKLSCSYIVCDSEGVTVLKHFKKLS